PSLPAAAGRPRRKSRTRHRCHRAAVLLPAWATQAAPRDAARDGPDLTPSQASRTSDHINLEGAPGPGRTADAVAETASGLRPAPAQPSPTRIIPARAHSSYRPTPTKLMSHRKQHSGSLTSDGTGCADRSTLRGTWTAPS